MPAQPLPEIPDRKRQLLDVLSPNLGLFLGRAKVTIPDRALSDGNNFRIRDGVLTNSQIGYDSLFDTDVALGHPCTLIADFVSSLGVSTAIFGTKRDLFRYDDALNMPFYITPNYSTGTVAVTNGSPVVTGTGTTWSASGIKAGDQINVGSAGQDSLLATWYTILSVDSDTQVTLTVNYPGVTNSGFTHTVRKLFTALDTTVWSWDVFPDAPLGTESGLPAGDRFIATNGAELIAWDGNADTVVVLSTASSGLGFACRAVAYFKNMMTYGNLVEGSGTQPGNVKNSAIGDPENVTTLEAGDRIVAQAIDFVKRLERLGDYLIAYCDRSVNVLQFIDAPVYFAIRTALPDVGLLASRLVANFGNYHEFIGTDQAYRFDGFQAVPYGNQVFDALLQGFDRGRSERASVRISREKLEAYWVLPMVSDEGEGPVSSWTEHYAEAAGTITPFSKRDMPATAVGSLVRDSVGRFSDYTGYTFAALVARFSDGILSADFPVVIFGDEDGYIRQLDTQTQQMDEAALRCFVTSPVRPLGVGEEQGVIRRVEPFARANAESGELTVRAETSSRMNGELVAAEKSYALDQSGKRFCSFRLAGRYGRVTFETLLAGQNWTLEGYRVAVDAAGDR